MKSLVYDSFFCGVISLQIAVFSFVYAQSWGDSAPISVFANRLASNHVEQGSRWPTMTAYDQRGIRQFVENDQGKNSAIILKSSCSCEDNQVSDWLDVERRRGEPVTLITALNSSEEAKVIARNHWKGRILRTRLIEFQRLGLLQQGAPKQLPIIVHLDANGVILGVQTSK